MKRILFAMAFLAVTALPSFAADAAMPDGGGVQQKGVMRPMMQQPPEVGRAMMRSPDHLLMMAYHKNFLAFAHVLAKLARQEDTLPPDFARATVAEMRRSADQMEMHRAAAMAAMPAGMKRPEMQKMMDEHIVQMKTELRDLEALVKRDRIPSQEVLKHLQFVMHPCDEEQCPLGPGRGMRGGMYGGGMYGGGMYGGGMYGKGGQPGCGCECRRMMTPDHRSMMEEMTRKLKAQDQELRRKVEKMKRAPKDKKVDMLADIVGQMVRQRADMTAHMEKMQKHMMQQGAAVTPPPPRMQGMSSSDGYDDEGDADTDDDTGGETVGTSY